MSSRNAGGTHHAAATKRLEVRLGIFCLETIGPPPRFATALASQNAM